MLGPLPAAAQLQNIARELVSVHGKDGALSLAAFAKVCCSGAVWFGAVQRERGLCGV